MKLSKGDSQSFVFPWRSKIEWEMVPRGQQLRKKKLSHKSFLIRSENVFGDKWRRFCCSTTGWYKNIWKYLSKHLVFRRSRAQILVFCLIFLSIVLSLSWVSLDRSHHNPTPLFSIYLLVLSCAACGECTHKNVMSMPVRMAKLLSLLTLCSNFISLTRLLFLKTNKGFTNIAIL